MEILFRNDCLTKFQSTICRQTDRQAEGRTTHDNALTGHNFQTPQNLMLGKITKANRLNIE